MKKRKNRTVNRRRIQTDAKPHRQLTLDSLTTWVQKKTSANETLLPSTNTKAASKHDRKIIITRINSLLEENELTIKIEFKLLPSRKFFSKIKSDLWFDTQKINSRSVEIPQRLGSTDEFQLNPVLLDLKGIRAGPHIVKAEMYEEVYSGKKRSLSSKEVTIEYLPQTRETRLKKVPIVKKIAGFEIAVVSDSERSVYRKIEEAKKKELISNRDEW